MREENKYAVSKFKKALDRLKEGVLEAKDELDKDGVIQRFEFTFEILWKSLKLFLEYEGIECRTPRACLKEAFRIGLIENENVFLNMLEDRNKLSHIYDKGVSEEILENVKHKYVKYMEKLLNKLSRWE